VEQWKSVEKNFEKREIVRTNDAKSWFVQLYLQRVWKGGKIRNGGYD